MRVRELRIFGIFAMKFEIMEISIDKGSGFCFGVVHAIEVAERELEEDKTLYCLGDIVHNQEEVKRLEHKGLKIIEHKDLDNLAGKKVLFRAHGEHPSTYLSAFSRGINVIDATCPVVLRLQNKIRKSFAEMEQINGQVVIFGKEMHPEVNGLIGQTLNRGIVISSMDDLSQIDFARPVRLFVQTTKSLDQFKEISNEIRRRMELASFGHVPDLLVADTICRQMSNRVPALQKFARKFQVVIFVSGKKSSNGNFLYNKCSEQNPNTYFISASDELNPQWFKGVETVGICGATSTPMWLMEEVLAQIENF